jgi:hypothetical protein
LERKSRVLFTLVAAYDVNLASIVAGLGHGDLIGRPPYASHVAVELWHLEELFVRFVANGQVLKVAGQEITPLSEFRKRFSK